MNKTKLEQLKKVIIKAVPEIVKLEFGCRIKNKQNHKNNFIIIKRQENSHLFLVFSSILLHCQEFVESYIKLNFKIIGRDIFLEDCLIAIDKKNLNYAMTSTGYFIKYGGVIGNSLTHKITNIKWQPNKSLRWHYENKPETIDFLHDLICNK